MAKDVDGIMTKLTLGDIDDQALLTKSLEEQAKLFFVHHCVLTSYQDVIIVVKGKIYGVSRVPVPALKKFMLEYQCRLWKI